jgi:phage virion morphogenesis protein
MADDILPIRIEFQSENAQDALSRLADGLKDGSLVEGVGAEVVKFSRNRILSRRNTAPDGTRWQDLTMATLLRKKKKGLGHQGTLMESGELWRTLKAINPTQGSVDIGTSSLYGLIHQKGGKTGKDHKVTLPARPYIGLDQQEAAQLMAWVHEWVEGLVEDK